LQVTPWDKRAGYPAAVTLGNKPRPWILSSQVLAGNTLSVHVAQPLDSLDRHNIERLWLFFLLAAAGGLLIIAASVLVIHLRESARMQAEHRVAATAFESQQGMIITDASQTILRVNQAFTEMSGYSADEIVGQTPRLLQSGRHDASFYAALWHTVRSTGVWQGEVWSRRNNGDIFPEWLLITAVKDDAGTITHFVGTLTDITARKQAEDEINNLAFYDPLTGLPNRRLLLDRLKQALATSARQHHHGALLFIDLDNFKDLNDNRGHQIGDLLLQQVATRLSACTREGDTTARFGGDEFVVMLENMSPVAKEAAEQARVVGDKILSSLNLPYQLADYAHHSTPSIGITLFSEHHGTTDDLLKRADLAMYQAKAAGRNTLRFFDPEMQAVVSSRATLEDDLRDAIRKGQFLLHYQAQVDQQMHLTGAEVLLRWQHPVRGMVSPADFIPLAESSGLILPLGHWVLKTACAQLAAWANQPKMARLTISVNVSARQFRHPDFVDQVMAVLDHTGANPQRLKLELTESLLVSDVEDIITKMTALKASGVGFSLDDFGTGYSSLSYLKRLPLDQLKIDQGFVRNILTDPNDAAIAKMVIALADSLGLTVIAEGVELDAQREFLASLGCLAYQGYLFGRPLPLAGFEARV
jgi:diguanylate cyclase (GGDEF)-like protein/PAS domain S-box-containing protein